MRTEIDCAPLEVFRRLRHLRHPVFLDSARYHPEQGRYSFLAADPLLTVSAGGRKVKISSSGATHTLQGNPWEIFETLLTRFRFSLDSEFSRNFGDADDCRFPMGAAMGYFGYDLANHLEKLPFPRSAPLPAPDLWFGFYDSIFAFDHRLHRAWLLSSGMDENGVPCSARAAFRRDQFLDELQSDKALFPQPASLIEGVAPLRSPGGHEKAIRKCLNYIRNGDIYQANLSHPFYGTTRFSAHDFYLRLRGSNPAPFGAFLDFGSGQVLSSSPESFLRMNHREVQTRPIKGTCPREGNPDSDQIQAQELVRSAKDQAELLMITDLLRNDLGKVAEFGTVEVPRLVQCEEFETVFHLVSTVKARLRPHVFHLDALMACFPGGSITGAPKLRAMEIIRELEPWGRGIYTGSLGYFGFNGVSDFNILIRTLLYREGRVYFHVGGGIVADSDPQQEYEETLHKARGILNLWKPEQPRLSRVSV